MAAVRYRRFLKLLEMWPVDELKAEGGRDFGKYLRKKVATAFNKGEMTSIADTPACDEIYESLYKIATDQHRQKYPKNRNYAASGCSLEDLKLLTSSEAIKMSQESRPSIFERISFFNRNN